MDSVFRHKKEKIRSRMVELKSELKILHSYLQQMSDKGIAFVQGLSEVSMELFLEKYISIHGYFIECISLVADLNCKLELLFLREETKDEATNSSLSGWGRRKNASDSSLGTDLICPKSVSSVGNDRDWDRHGELIGSDSEGLGNPPKNNVSSNVTQPPRPPPSASSDDLEDGEKNPTDCGLQPSESAPSRCRDPRAPPASDGVASEDANGPGRILNDGGAARPNDDSGAAQEKSDDDGELGVRAEEAASAEDGGGAIEQLVISTRKGDTYDVVLTHLVSPDEFYGHVQCRDLSLMTEMEGEINNYFAGKNCEETFHNSMFSYSSLKKLARRSLGIHVMGYCVNLSRWTRLRILDWLFNEDTDIIHVFYIDYGYTGDIPIGRIRPMDPMFKKYPQFSQRFYLSGVRPRVTKADESVREWSDDDKIMFGLFFDCTNNYRVKVEVSECGGCGVDGSVGVRVILPESGVSIGDKLVEFSVAVFSGSEEECGSSATPEKGCGGEEGGGLGTPAVRGPVHGCHLPTLAAGETVHVTVTCLRRINKFFCVRDYPKTNDPDVLQELVGSMNGEEAKSQMTPMVDPPSMGDLVIGKYEDGYWYRAKVVKSDPDPEVYKLLFLDYGNTEKVSLKDMRKMERKYLELPFQMMECHMEGIALRSGANPEDVLGFLQGRIEEGVTITVRRVLDGEQPAYSVDVRDRDGHDIVSDLISNNYAVPTDDKRLDSGVKLELNM